MLLLEAAAFAASYQPSVVLPAYAPELSQKILQRYLSADALRLAAKPAAELEAAQAALRAASCRGAVALLAFLDHLEGADGSKARHSGTCMHVPVRPSCVRV